MFRKDLYWKEKYNDTVYWSEDFSDINKFINFNSIEDFMKHRKKNNYSLNFSNILEINTKNKNSKNVYWKKNNSNTIYFSEDFNNLKKFIVFNNIQSYMFHRKKYDYPQNFFFIKVLSNSNKLNEIYYPLASNSINFNKKNNYYAKFPINIVNKVNEINCEKKYNYIFIGSYKNNLGKIFNRKWIFSFIKNNFDNKSYLEFTDNETKKNYIKKGNFDHTLDNNTKNENNFDYSYYNKLKKSKFCLCPAGDCIYSVRFYEALLCKTIPIVSNKVETYRSKAEKKIDYKFYLSSEKNKVYNQEMIDHNYKIFLKYHT